MSQPVDSRILFGRFSKQKRFHRERVAFAKHMSIQTALTSPIVGTPVWEQELPKKPPGRR